MLSFVLCAVAGVLIGRGFGKRYDGWAAVGLALPFGAALGGAINAIFAVAFSGVGYGEALLRVAFVGAIIGAVGGAYGAFIAYLRRRNGVSG